MIEPTDKTSQQPLLSVVATARNDNHGGQLLERMQIFVNGVLEQCERHDIDAELILVDWNPPEDKPHLCDALTWPKTAGRCRVRIIEVPNEVHVKMQHSTLPLFQMIAKNVGIRRARGKYVLATNIDILFSDPVFQFLKSDQLKPGYMYRVNRFDVPENVPENVSLDEQLLFCQQNIIRKHFFEGSFDCRTRKWSSWRENVQTRRGRFWNFLRRIRHKTKTTTRTARNHLINRVVYTKNLARLLVRRHYNNVKNYIGHYYRKTRGYYRRIVSHCGHVYRVNRNHVRNYTGHYYRTVKGVARNIYYRCGHTVRTYRNMVLNTLRHRYNTTFRGTVRKAKYRGGELQRWVHPTKGPRHWQFWVYLLLIPFRIVLLILWLIWDIVRGCMRQVSRLFMWLLGTSRVQTAVDHFLVNDNVNAFRVRAAHLRRRFKLWQRVTAMTARDRFPKWLDEASFMPPRSNSSTRDLRIAYFQRRIDWMKQTDRRRIVPHLTSYQLWQRELMHLAQLRQRRREEIWERRRKKQKRQAKERRRLRKIDYDIERKRCAGWRAWGKEKLKELAIRDKQLRKELAIQQKEELRLQKLERQRLQLEEKLERERLQELARQRPAQTELSEASLAAAGVVAAAEAEAQAQSAVAVCEAGTAGEHSADGEFKRNGQHSSPSSPSQSGTPSTVEHAPGSNGSPVPAWKASRDRKEKLRLEWPYLHTNGCGDFTMLAYEDWAALGGYAEFEMYSMHIDSLFLVAGAHHGLKQFVLGSRAPIYHIEHGIGSGWTPEGEEKLKQRLREAKIPQLSHDEFMDYDLEMARTHKAVMFNGPNWGLAEINLPEIDII